MTSRTYVQEPQWRIGSLPPLFDRLRDDETEQNLWRADADIYWNPQQLIDSIIAEVSRILNTRTFARDDDSPYDFGLSDLHGFDPENPKARSEIAQACEKTIERFEPRLMQVRVRVEGVSLNRTCVHLSVQGAVMLNRKLSAFRFPMDLGAG